MPYRALLIDLDGVIRHWEEPEESVETRFGLPASSIATIAFTPELLLPAITGGVTDAQWRSSVAQQLARNFQGCDAAGAVANWSASPGEVDLETLALLDRCQVNLRIILATNATSRLPDDLGALGLSNKFHAVLNSSELGAAKPTEAFYRAALIQIGLEPDQVLFIDDSLANVEAAHAFGMLAHRFESHQAMADFLEHAGVLDGAAG